MFLCEARQECLQTATENKTHGKLTYTISHGNLLIGIEVKLFTNKMMWKFLDKKFEFHKIFHMLKLMCENKFHMWNYYPM